MSSSPPPEWTPPGRTAAKHTLDPQTQPISQQPVGPASAAADGSRAGRRPLTIRSKLIVSIVALITVVCAVIGVTTEIFLSRYLVGQVDRQLAEIHQFGTTGPDRPRTGGPIQNQPQTCADGDVYGP